jgi:DNA/RNA endonuclease YhcR with UshA esterase domain
MEKLAKISIAIAIIGIAVLILISSTFQPKSINLKDINSNTIGQKVKISGKVISEKDYSNEDYFRVLTLQDETGKIQVTCNCKTSLVNKTIEVTGTAEEFKKQPQINANKIEEIK